jgi:integrase
MAGPRVLHRLNATRVRTLKGPGTYEDGGGLRLVIDRSGARRWVMRVSIGSKRRELGLGGYPTVSLEAAREKAGELRKAAKDGRDLAAERRAARRAGVTFRQAFEEFFTVKRQALSNAKHLAQWPNTMSTYVFPRIGDRPVGCVTAGEVLDVLTPIWFEKPETAKRVLQRMEVVFRSAILRGHREAASPCIGVVQELGTKHRKVEHHPSLPHQDVPAFIQRLMACPNQVSTRLALEWLILTACRSGEVRLAHWEEIDRRAAVWTIPASRMKARRAHAVPLSNRCREILEEVRAAHPTSDLIFPGTKPGRPMSDMTLTALLRRMQLADSATAHGFRSTFKVWCAEVAKVRDEVSEAALAHTIPEKVRAAYLRTNFLEERRALMEAWAAYATQQPPLPAPQGASARSRRAGWA